MRAGGAGAQAVRGTLIALQRASIGATVPIGDEDDRLRRIRHRSSKGAFQVKAEGVAGEREEAQLSHQIVVEGERADTRDLAERGAATSL